MTRSWRARMLILVASAGAAAIPGIAAGDDHAAVAPSGPGVLAIVPSGGVLGSQPFFALRAGYAIATPIAIEAEFGHNLGEATSAFLHSAGVRVNAFAVQRAHFFATTGFGTFSATPTDALAAKSLTRSHLHFGGGVEYAIRDDFGVRLDVRHHRILLGGGEAGGETSLGTNEVSVGLSFSRRIWSPPSSSSTTP